MHSSRRGAAVVVVLSAVGLAACAPTAPPSVVPGSSVVVGWSAELTSLNAAAHPTAGNLDIAAATRSRFGDTVDGDFIPDESFGTASIAGDDPFTVRYDLAEPSWSDGIPVDAADLMLGWAGAAGAFAADGGSSQDEAPAPPVVDEFARAIEVTFPAPTISWQTAVSAPVPAHVVGERAFGLDDPMEAKQAVLRALAERDAAATAAIAEEWDRAFEIAADGDTAPEVLISSGPYLLDGIDGSGGDQTVRLVPNPGYRGAATPRIARVDLVPRGKDPAAAVGDSLDLVTLAPTADNRGPIREKERRDFAVQATHDGTVWSVLLRPDRIFSDRAARAAFLRVVPADEMVAAGAGEWARVYAKSTSMVAAPGSRAFDIVNEDSGFTDALGTPADDPPLDRSRAGVPARTRVCVLYDRGSAFAAGAFTALQKAAKEAGWAVADCGSDDVSKALSGGGWNAVIDRVRIPQTPDEMAAQWGSEGAASVTGHADADRDDLIATLAETVDVYAARELTARIERTIVDAAVARPIAVNPRVTIVDPGLSSVTVRNGSRAPVMSGIAQWAPAG
ncbi:ABC transporter substrate-binding protein [Microbacterium sp. 179-B 1A2 NHS]|uniref:ABC transporter substrate-binding protein n=1 Tax=Microbacterium sp. 179-B 1A2 NHS TaxID=3142383 RepID=UPI00399FDC30